MRDVVVAVYDSRKLVKILNMLNNYMVSVKGIDERIRRIHGIVIADENGLKYMDEMHIEVNGIVLNIDSIGIERGTIMGVILSRTSDSEIESVIIGIDYGEKIGIAILANSDVVFVNSYRDKVEALRVVRMFIDGVNAERKIVRIGLPSKHHRGYDNFVESLANTVKDSAIVEFVSENGSSKRKLVAGSIKIDEDSLAAVNIALQRIYND
uniref:Uncharacterized protein n=1 Tax=Ignisphaera aggregans TaxID=334771 RepID=A0A7J3I7L4_9CREN